MVGIKTCYHITKQAGQEWLNDKAPLMGAALAFYSVLSIGPLLLIVISIAGLVFGVDAASGRLVSQMEGLVGKGGAELIQTTIKNSYDPHASLIAITIGIITLIVGATGVFGQLQDSLNTIWKAKPKRHSSIFSFIKNRFISFAMVLGTGFLLLISLVISTALSALNEFSVGLIPSLKIIMQITNFTGAFLITTLLFAMIYKILPDTRIKWQDVWIGAILTAIMFTVGKFLISLYLGHSSFSSTYGAAGSVIVILVWVYYSSQILFFGAELTKICAKNFTF